MKNEAEMNTIIKNSIIASGGVAHKIPDPQGMAAVSSTQRPFDGFGSFEGKPIYWESKFSKSLRSFDLSKIDDHQAENLEAFKKDNPNSLCLIFYGAYVKRGDSRIFMFSDLEDILRRRENKENFKKKELETLKYSSVKKKLFDFTINNTN